MSQRKVVAGLPCPPLDPAVSANSVWRDHIEGRMKLQSSYSNRRQYEQAARLQALKVARIILWRFPEGRSQLIYADIRV